MAIINVTKNRRVWQRVFAVQITIHAFKRAVNLYSVSLPHTEVYWQRCALARMACISPKIENVVPSLGNRVESTTHQIGMRKAAQCRWERAGHRSGTGHRVTEVGDRSFASLRCSFSRLLPSESATGPVDRLLVVRSKCGDMFTVALPRE